jgi:HAD superfamily hydrolase (TIGR01459 family)
MLKQNPRIIRGLFEVMELYEGYIVDIYGVLHDGLALFPWTIETLETLKQENKKVIFLSNSPRRASVVEQSLSLLGLPRELYDDVYTSGEDAYQQLKNPKDNFYKNLTKFCFAFSDPHHYALFSDLDLIKVKDIEEASFILSTGPGDFSDKERDEILHKAYTLHLPMICVNPDVAVLIGDKLTPCAGSVAQKYEEIGGKVTYHGKPFSSVYENVLQKMMSIEKEKILALGDSLATDVKGACLFGLHCALVMSGLEGRALDQEAQSKKLLDLCQKSAAFPTYVLKRFEL